MKTVIESDGHLLKDLSKKLLDDLRNHGIDEDVVFDIYIGFEEALRNALVHGNKSNPEKKIIVEIVLSESRSVLYIQYLSQYRVQYYQ